MWTRRNEPQRLPDWQTWIRFWDILSERMQLRTIRLQLQYVGPKAEMTLGSAWVKPILKLHNLERAEVTLTLCHYWAVWEDLNQGIRSSMLRKEPTRLKN